MCVEKNPVNTLPESLVRDRQIPPRHIRCSQLSRAPHTLQIATYPQVKCLRSENLTPQPASFLREQFRYTFAYAVKLYPLREPFSRETDPPSRPPPLTLRRQPRRKISSAFLIFRAPDFFF